VTQLWEVSDRPCAKLLAPLLPTLLAALERHGELRLASEERASLLALSPATLDRLLAPGRRRLGRQPRRPPTAGATLKGQIPLRTFGEWQDVAPGSLQGDLVLHCGESPAGFFLSTLVTVDVATSWTELEAIWGGGQQRVGTGVHRVRQRLPFPLREWHTDNGSEFLNRILVPWCRREGIHVTRYSSRAAYTVLHRLYGLLRLQLNFFRAVRKLVSKHRVGAKVIKHSDAPQTPSQRLLAAGLLSAAQQQKLAQEFLAINPATLARQITQTLETLWKLRESHAVGNPAHLG
jgi:hypothetical protein